MKRAALLTALLLAGCATPAPPAKIITRVVIQRTPIPAQLFLDPPPPAAPKVNSAASVSSWIVRLWADDLNKTDQITAIRKITGAKP